MNWNQYIRISGIFLMAALLCSAVGAAGVGIIAETRDVSGGGTPVCTAPCECISEAEAAMRWGAEGYDRCSKTICGQSANAMVQYYCFHPVGGVAASSVTSCQAPCECMAESTAVSRWGANGYTQCTKTLCGQDAATGGTVAKYCFRQWGSAGLVIGGGATPTTAPMAASQQAVQAPVQTQLPAEGLTPDKTYMQTPVVTETPSQAWPTQGAVLQRMSLGTATVLAAIGFALLAAAGLRRK